MKTDKSNPNHLLADTGKVLQRISDNQIFGQDIYLGYTHYIAGERLPEPLLELPEHFREIDAPEEYLIDNLNNESL